MGNSRAFSRLRASCVRALAVRLPWSGPPLCAPEPAVVKCIAARASRSADAKSPERIAIRERYARVTPSIRGSPSLPNASSAARSIRRPSSRSPRNATTRPRLWSATAARSARPIRSACACAARSASSAPAKSPSSASTKPRFARSVAALRWSRAPSNAASAATKCSRHAPEVAVVRGADPARQRDLRAREDVDRRRVGERGPVDGQDGRVGRGVEPAERELVGALGEAHDLRAPGAGRGLGPRRDLGPALRARKTAQLGGGADRVLDGAEPRRRAGLEQAHGLRAARLRGLEVAPPDVGLGLDEAERAELLAGGAASVTPRSGAARARRRARWPRAPARPRGGTSARALAGSPPRRKCSAIAMASVRAVRSSQSPASRWPSARSASVSMAYAASRTSAWQNT